MNAPDLRNLPPHSLEAEHGLLGAILTHGAKYRVGLAEAFMHDHDWDGHKI